MAPRIKTVEVHVDACARLGANAIRALEALNNLYNITGMRQLRYI